MRPELFNIPLINISIKSYGFMMVLGFIAALFLARRLCRRLGENPIHISNFGTYALLAGIVGARLFHVIHYWPLYRGNISDVFAIWTGGLEFLGGFFGALIVMVIYFRRRKLSVLRFLDILAPALVLGLAFGRIGCFLNGCCFGAPAELPWAIRFPALSSHSKHQPGCQKAVIFQYSIPFSYQLTPDFQRRDKSLITLPNDFYDGYMNHQGHWVRNLELIDPDQRHLFFAAPKAPGELTTEQLQKLRDGTIKMLPIHPAQLYSSMNSFILCLILLLFITRYYYFSGQIFAMLMILYGVTRFVLESLRNSSPLEFNGLTISQNISIITFAVGLIALPLLFRRKNS